MNRPSTALHRFIGAELRRHREAADWSGLRLARHIGWTQGTISRLESGRRRTTAANLAIYLTVCGVPIPEQDRLLALAAQDEVWLCPHDGLSPDEVPALRFTRESAAHVTCYHPGGLPEFLCTTEFTAWRSPTRTEEADQEWLHRTTGPDLVCYLPESALRSIPHAKSIRSGQLVSLAMLTGQGRVTLRVVPGASEQRVPAVGPFWLFGFDGTAPVVGTQSDTITVFSERQRDVAVYQRIAVELAELALSAPDSVELIVQLADRAAVLTDRVTAVPGGHRP